MHRMLRTVLALIAVVGAVPAAAQIGVGPFPQLPWDEGPIRPRRAR